MMLNKIKNSFVEGAAGRPVLLDITFLANGIAKPVVLFWHGFKGFKDWGCWELIGEEFAKKGMVFIACNFSHNGTTPEAPDEFGDLEAFGQNNYSKELYDMKAVLDWLEGASATISNKELDLSAVYLIGHSRGGGIGIIHTAQDKRIKKLVTWAAVSRLDYLWKRNPEVIAPWRTNGVHYIFNGRTKQQMPLYFQLYEDFERHQEAYDISGACQSMQQPLLIVHGTSDPAVPVSMAEELAAWHPNSELVLIEGADHVFGGKHPYTRDSLPALTEEMVRRSIDFLLE